MPYWVEFNQMRTGKDAELFDDMSSFKKIKVYRNRSDKKKSISFATISSGDF